MSALDDERAALILDSGAGACAANGMPGRIWPDCLELGYWKPFYQAYVCRLCIEADRASVGTGRKPEWWVILRSAPLRSVSVVTGLHR